MKIHDKKYMTPSTYLEALNFGLLIISPILHRCEKGFRVFRVSPAWMGFSKVLSGHSIVVFAHSAGPTIGYRWFRKDSGIQHSIFVKSYFWRTKVFGDHVEWIGIQCLQYKIWAFSAVVILELFDEWYSRNIHCHCDASTCGTSLWFVL